jgi:hypothetical protein
MNAFQCICGSFISFHGEPGEAIPCPRCGTEWTQTSVKLVDGTFYLIKENGMWVLQEYKIKPKIEQYFPVPKIWGNY